MSLLAAAVLAGLPWAPGARASVSTGPARIASIEVERVNVFDLSRPGEDWWPFRIADRIHVMTREGVIRRELLFHAGGPFDPLRALETERNLR
ncbi:MAG: hypothetical protein KGL53_17180, partial [Elusimicrobia bacterium]|nr:hypothetical protein [Elusimicrobiota bacterium]